MSLLDFSQCKTIEEIDAKLLNSRDIPNDVARASVFVQHLLQKELLLIQNKFQKEQLEKMEILNKWTRGLVTATWALVVITLVTAFLLPDLRKLDKSNVSVVLDKKN